MPLIQFEEPLNHIRLLNRCTGIHPSNSSDGFVWNLYQDFYEALTQQLVFQENATGHDRFCTYVTDRKYPIYLKEEEC